MEKVEPYWHKNKEWYYYDVKERIFKLTDKAPQQAKKDYNEYYKNQKKTG